MDDNIGCAAIITLIILLIMFMFGVNACTEEDWNSGNCPKCETRYELRGVHDGLKYYACPDCGKEVERY